MPSDRQGLEAIEQTIRDEIAGRIERRHGSRPIVTAEQTLEGLGLDSLDVHELVDTLETKVHLNPFEHAFSVNDVRTVHDLYRAYRAASGAGSIADAGSDEILLASRRRAEACRRRST
jgi:acyl carrier protein